MNISVIPGSPQSHCEIKVVVHIYSVTILVAPKHWRAAAPNMHNITWPTFVVRRVSAFLGEGVSNERQQYCIEGYHNPLSRVCWAFRKDFTLNMYLEAHVLGYHRHEGDLRNRVDMEEPTEECHEWVQLPDGKWRRLGPMTFGFFAGFISHHLDDLV